jgi:hypothetical protein
MKKQMEFHRPARWSFKLSISGIEMSSASGMTLRMARSTG